MYKHLENTFTPQQATTLALENTWKKDISDAPIIVSLLFHPN